MKALNSKEIREKFIKFFEDNNHLKIKASSLVPKNDPTLLFINSGMAPLKDFFLGKAKPKNKRLCNFQPCIRTKDIDDVGDRHHLTLFEMLGSWSIGDYYKDEAIRLAYELLVSEFGFDPKKLYMTVYSGNKEHGIPADLESVKAWKKVGVPDDHIIMMGEDNFWGPAGETGPCGPCTEVFYDTGDKFGPKYKPGGKFDDVGRYIEIWNAGVFMELNKQKDGSFTSLPLKSVDTGSGLERMAMVMNGHESVYETDLMQPLMDLSANLLKDSKESNEIKLKKTRMISDHLRAATLILSEGVMPSNEGQGYIPRRLLRKVVAALLSSGQKEIKILPHVDIIVELLCDYYPLLKSAKDTIVYNIENEIKEFTPIVLKGIEMIDEELARGTKKLTGKFAFDLVTTYGLPVDVLKSELDNRKASFDEKEYKKCYEEHRTASRVISKSAGSTDMNSLEEFASQYSDTIFKGYDCTSLDCEVLGVLDGADKSFVITKETPFYAESGGQAGDHGKIFKEGVLVGHVEDTLKINNVHVHVVCLEKNKKLENKINLVVDNGRREAIKKHHSATHLLHSALHKVIGKHAIQKGSLVNEEKLRFDFQHNKPLTKEEIREIESLVNQWVQLGNTTDVNTMSYDKAISAGAMALFGEKYDSDVRVVSFGENSTELCGGTHVSNVGEIGLFIITVETSVAKGIRRIEALAGMQAFNYLKNRNEVLADVCRDLNVKPNELGTKVKELKKKKKDNTTNSSSFKINKEEKFELKNVGSLLLASVEGSNEDIKSYGDKLIDKKEVELLVLMGADDKKLRAFAWVTKDKTSKIKAGDLLKKTLEPLDGKGGGRPHFAQGGATDVNGAEKVFAHAAQISST